MMSIQGKERKGVSIGTSWYPPSAAVLALALVYRTELRRSDGLHMLGLGSGTVGKCGLVGVGVALWVWVCPTSTSQITMIRI